MEQNKREKVIKGLECCMAENDKAWPECESCPYKDSHDSCTSMRPMFKDALALLKAQEPQPPIIMNGRRFQIKKCPKCYMTIKADEKPNFCSNCGQAVKWE